MEQGDSKDSVGNDLDLPSYKGLMDEANNEFFESITEGLLPKVKIFLPKVIKTIDEDTNLVIKQNEMIVITRSEEDGTVIVVKGSKDDIELHGNIDRCDINDLSSIFNMMLDMMVKQKM